MVLWKSREDDGWRQRPVKLPKNHGWVASPGNSVFVANRGEVIFEFPRTWVITPMSAGATRISDKKPPEEKIRFDILPMRFERELRADATLDEMLETLMVHDKARDMIGRGPIQQVHRQNFDAVWLHGDFIDPDEMRKAHVRVFLARRDNFLAQITSDFYPEMAKPAIEAWDRMLVTLRIGEYIEDHTLRSRNN